MKPLSRRNFLGTVAAVVAGGRAAMEAAPQREVPVPGGWVMSGDFPYLAPGEAVVLPPGCMKVQVEEDVRPGDWLVTGEGGRLAPAKKYGDRVVIAFAKQDAKAGEITNVYFPSLHWDR